MTALDLHERVLKCSRVNASAAKWPEGRHHLEVRYLGQLP